MLTPEDINEEIKEYNEEIKEYNETKLEIIRENPWLIPASVALMAIPMAVSIHGFWKNAQLKKRLKIEREKTKQLQMEQLPKIRPFHNF